MDFEREPLEIHIVIVGVHFFQKRSSIITQEWVHLIAGGPLELTDVGEKYDNNSARVDSEIILGNTGCKSNLEIILNLFFETYTYLKALQLIYWWI